METVDTQTLVPEKFEPTRRHRWVMMLDDIDAYLVNRVELPVVDSTRDEHMTLCIHNVVGDDLNVRMRSWLASPTPRSGELKFLDPTGAVVESWKFSARPEKMWHSELDYESPKPWMTYLQLRLDVLEISCPSSGRGCPS